MIQGFIVVGNSIVLFLFLLGVHHLTYINVSPQSNVKAKQMHQVFYTGCPATSCYVRQFKGSGSGNSHRFSLFTNPERATKATHRIPQKLRLNFNG